MKRKWCKECKQYIPDEEICQHLHLIKECNICGTASRVPLGTPKRAHLIRCEACGEKGNWKFLKPEAYHQNNEIECECNMNNFMQCEGCLTTIYPFYKTQIVTMRRIKFPLKEDENV
jgi:hypothetical protein